jgi:hypothetical protein
MGCRELTRRASGGKAISFVVAMLFAGVALADPHGHVIVTVTGSVHVESQIDVCPAITSVTITADGKPVTLSNWVSTIGSSYAWGVLFHTVNNVKKIQSATPNQCIACSFSNQDGSPGSLGVSLSSFPMSRSAYYSYDITFSGGNASGMGVGATNPNQCIDGTFFSTVASQAAPLQLQSKPCDPPPKWRGDAGPCVDVPQSGTLRLDGSIDAGVGVHTTYHGAFNVSVEPCPGNPSVSIYQIDTPSNDSKDAGSDRSFVSTDTLSFQAKLGCDKSRPEWKSGMSQDNGNGSLSPVSFTGEPYKAKPQPFPPTTSDGARDNPIEYTVTATDSGSEDKQKIKQDDIDTIRQQYIDMRKQRTPARSEFIDSGGSAHFTFAQIQDRSSPPAAWAIFSVFGQLEQWRTNYGDELPHINRGYSTPKHNAHVSDAGNPAAKNSTHIYGVAVDLAANRNTDPDTWNELAQAGLDTGACIEPTSTHVHGDWRAPCPSTW